jgi:hypothetical protein
MTCNLWLPLTRARLPSAVESRYFILASMR